MADILSPNPTVQKRVSMAARLQSPTSPFFLGSNDDHQERAQARAARAAAIRRKSVALNMPPVDGDSDPCLGKEQILELFQNCIKLASENKINQKNTWELNLIDHLAEIITVEKENDSETNFQKASCTLEAGVKIYSLRVDSVHSEAYKVLGGMNRAGQQDEQETSVEDGNSDNGQSAAPSKKEMDRKMSPLSTLESSFEALNVKKFDVAFAVDPLYHQTSAQFDEGGARGLLMNNLGVYGGCKVLFDSSEVPGKCISCDNQHDQSDTIDLSFASEYVEEMVLNMRTKDEISPTLRSLVDRFDEDNRRPPNIYSCPRESVEQVDAACSNEVEFDDDVPDNCGNWDYDHEDQTSVVEEGLNCESSTFPSFHEENEPGSFHDLDRERLEKVDGILFLSLGFSSKENAWAGPDHWKYRKTKGPEVNPAAEPPVTVKRQGKKAPQPELDFTKALEEEMPDIFAPPKNPKSLLLPANRAPCNTRLPEDCHYQPEDLIKLFLLPNVKCLGRRSRKSTDESRQRCDDYGEMPFCEDDGAFGGQYEDDAFGGQHDDGNNPNDVDDFSTLVSQPRQVNKIEVQYDKASKQVDVQALKETLWNHVQESVQGSTQGEEQSSVSFKQMLASFPSDCRAAASISEISPHLCFICLLHLANEHGLRILGNTNMDDLTVHLSLNEASSAL